MNYSQNNEQQIILDYFGNYVGTFLDFGANDGITLSNTYALYEKGWTPVWVEASPYCVNKLLNLAAQKNYPLVNVVGCAVGSENGKVTFYESTGGGHDRSLVSTIIPKEKERWNAEWNEIQVEIKTVQTILSKFDYTFDFVNIDVEGMDYQVLTQLDLTDTKMVCVEWNSKEAAKYVDYCQGYGLKEIARNPENLIFAR